MSKSTTMSKTSNVPHHLALYHLTLLVFSLAVFIFGGSTKLFAQSISLDDFDTVNFLWFTLESTPLQDEEGNISFISGSIMNPAAAPGDDCVSCAGAPCNCTRIPGHFDIDGNHVDFGGGLDMRWADQHPYLQLPPGSMFLTGTSPDGYMLDVTIIPGRGGGLFPIAICVTTLEGLKLNMLD